MHRPGLREHLRRQGLPVDVLAGLSTRQIVAPALQQGLVDLVADYTGTLLDFDGGQLEGCQVACRGARHAARTGR